MQLSTAQIVQIGSLMPFFVTRLYEANMPAKMEFFILYNLTCLCISLTLMNECKEKGFELLKVNFRSTTQAVG